MDSFHSSSATNKWSSYLTEIQRESSNINNLHEIKETEHEHSNENQDINIPFHLSHHHLSPNKAKLSSSQSRAQSIIDSSSSISSANHHEIESPRFSIPSRKYRNQHHSTNNTHNDLQRKLQKLQQDILSKNIQHDIMVNKEEMMTKRLKTKDTRIQNLQSDVKKLRDQLMLKNEMIEQQKQNGLTDNTPYNDNIKHCIQSTMDPIIKQMDTMKSNIESFNTHSIMNELKQEIRNEIKNTLKEYQDLMHMNTLKIEGLDNNVLQWNDNIKQYNDDIIQNFAAFKQQSQDKITKDNTAISEIYNNGKTCFQKQMDEMKTFLNKQTDDNIQIINKNVLNQNQAMDKHESVLNNDLKQIQLRLNQVYETQKRMNGTLTEYNVVNDKMKYIINDMRGMKESNELIKNICSDIHKQSQQLPHFVARNKDVKLMQQSVEGLVTKIHKDDMVSTLMIPFRIWCGNICIRISNHRDQCSIYMMIFVLSQIAFSTFCRKTEDNTVLTQIQTRALCMMNEIEKELETDDEVNKEIMMETWMEWMQKIESDEDMDDVWIWRTQREMAHFCHLQLKMNKVFVFMKNEINGLVKRQSKRCLNMTFCDSLLLCGCTVFVVLFCMWLQSVQHPQNNYY